MQPAYLPWLGYFHRLMLSDVHIVLDSVPASKGDFSNRNRIRTAQGWTWLTVPVVGDRMTTPISDLGTDTKQRWNEKHWRSIEHAYRRAPFFQTYADRVRECVLRPYDRLEAACLETLDPVIEAMGISTPMRFSRDLEVNERKSDLVLRLCQRAGATTYISGPFGREYLDLPSFERAGIDVLFHDYDHPRYPQVYPGFEPYMSAIDLLFNCGPRIKDVIAQTQNALEKT